MRNKNLLYLFLCSFSFLLLSSCRLYNLEKKLDPENQEWLSKVRYTITGEERKVFLELPPSEREEFKKEFWKKRDYDPGSGENEFKKEYYRRIDYANKHFIGGGRPGYLQDRGRVYILFGPPHEVVRYPSAEPPYEVWGYNRFPVVFVDRYHNGDYRIVTENLGLLSGLNTALANLRHRQEKQLAEYEEGKAFFDINVKVGKDENNDALLSIEVPYKNIWLKDGENVLETILELSFEIFNVDKVKIWEFRKDYHISLTEEELPEKMDESYFIRIPLSLNEGKYSLLLELINKTGDEKLKKSITFSI